VMDLAVMLAGWMVVKRICVSLEKSVIVSGAGKRGGGGWCGEQTDGERCAKSKANERYDYDWGSSVMAVWSAMRWSIYI
jgi:hypothetical protein